MFFFVEGVLKTIGGPGVDTFPDKGPAVTKYSPYRIYACITKVYCGEPATAIRIACATWQVYKPHSEVLKTKTR